MKNILAEFFERDINKLIDEVNLFQYEQNLWRTQGDVKNSAGNLILHIIGGTNYRIGTVLGNTGYIRDRDAEFSKKNVDAPELIVELKKLITVVVTTINGLKPEDMEKEYPVFFDKPGTSNGYVLTQLLLHLSYHLGQVNYLRRILEY